MNAYPAMCPCAGRAFDSMAADYDANFTWSQIGRAQRGAVWDEALKVFQDRHSILELNCGTGEDALFLASRGHSVTALDASTNMISRAMERKREEAPDAAIHLRVLPTEQLAMLPPNKWDAVFSNFSGLNCVDDLASVANQLAIRTPPGAPMLLCLSTRFCLWETMWYLLSGEPRKAIRRWSGHSAAILNGIRIEVHYPGIAAVQRAFSPHFKLTGAKGIGICVPPSYLEPWMQGRTRLLGLMQRLDSRACKLPGIRGIGDHILLHLVRQDGTHPC